MVRLIKGRLAKLQYNQELLLVISALIETTHTETEEYYQVSKVSSVLHDCK